MFELNKLAPLKKKRKRVGRGGSRGGTSGKGGKGQTARSGGSIRPGFEGGQMPLYRRLPKRGFNNARFETDVQTVNIEQLNEMFSDGAVITKDSLVERGLIKGHKSKGPFVLKVLGSGSLTKKVTVHADRFSESAKKAIVSAGGTVQVIEEK